MLHHVASSKDRCFGGTYRLHYKGDKNRCEERISSQRASVVPCSPILVTLMMKAIRSSETSVLTRGTQRNIQEDNILHSHRRETSNRT
jgi:hypothetical protein